MVTWPFFFEGGGGAQVGQGGRVNYLHPPIAQAFAGPEPENRGPGAECNAGPPLSPQPRESKLILGNLCSPKPWVPVICTGRLPFGSGPGGQGSKLEKNLGAKMVPEGKNQGAKSKNYPTKRPKNGPLSPKLRGQMKN